jgi:Kef-type K+ transport system membrane component KefB
MIMEEILLLTAVIYVIALIFGYLAQRYLRMPWMFSLVIFGLIFSAFGFFTQVTKSENFQLLANLGMLALLFMIGLDLNLKEIKSLGPYIAGGDLFLCFFEGTMLALLFYFCFPADVSSSFPIALITGVTFGTIGEVVLFAILAEFGLVNTKFGQLSLGMGVFDDVVEVAMLAIIATLPAFSSTIQVQRIPDIKLIFFGLVVLLVTTFAIVKVCEKLRKLLDGIRGPPYIPPFLILLTFFSFAAIGAIIYENLAPVAAIMGGIVTQQIFPEKVLKESRKSIDFLGNFFLSPFFFLSLGTKMSLAALVAFPLIIVIVLVSFSSRVLASTMLFRKLFGAKHAFILGVGLCAKFSTSIIAENLLFTSGFISTTLFSAIVTAYIIMKPIIVGVYSWGLSTVKVKSQHHFPYKIQIHI